MSDDTTRPLSEQASARVLRELLDGLRVRLREPVTALFDALDDTLFEMGENARSGDAQQHYFDALRECRRQRGAVQEHFLAALGQSEATADESPHPLHAQLSLVAPEDLEVELALDGMATRTIQRLGSALHAFNQRFGVLLGDPGMGLQRNPLGPLRIGKTFSDASALLEIDLHTRLVLYKLFERQVLGALEPAYAEMNVRLAGAGMLPILDAGHGHARAHPSGQPRSQQQALHRPATSTAQVPADAYAEPVFVAATVEPRDVDLFVALRTLLMHDIESAALAYTAPPSATVQKTATAAEVMDRALARLRERPLAGPPLPPPRMLAAQLLAEARYADDGLPPSSQQAATVDIVGRVFDALSNDRSMPPPMQPVMQSLLLPVMRASLKHPGLLAENHHPLRQLIDLIGESAIGWCPSVDPGERSLADLRDALQKIATSESSEEADRTVVQLRSQLEQQRRRAELAEQRAVEAHAGRERLWQARRQVSMALTQIIGDATIPTWVRYLVTRPWMNCLVLLWLRQGPESQTYREALGFAESLVWCANVGKDRLQHLRLHALLPVMEVQLRQGLATVAYQDSEIRQLVDELQQYVRFRMGELPAPAFIETEPPAANSPGALATDPSGIEEQPLPQNVNPELLKRVRALRPGTWLTFDDQPGSERARLSWVSPYSGRCLFVNRNGLKIGERRPEDIAHALENGHARILDNTQVMQRALTQVLAQVRTDSAAAQAKRA